MRRQEAAILGLVDENRKLRAEVERLTELVDRVHDLARNGAHPLTVVWAITEGRQDRGASLY